MHAEIAYLFRHVLLRDAAYEMQLPSDRAKLHELAFHLIEQAFGGRPPEPPPLDSHNSRHFPGHSTDVVAAELAAHALLAGDELAGLHARYMRRAAEHAQRHLHPETPSMW